VGGDGKQVQCEEGEHARVGLQGKKNRLSPKHLMALKISFRTGLGGCRACTGAEKKPLHEGSLCERGVKKPGRKSAMSGRYGRNGILHHLKAGSEGCGINKKVGGLRKTVEGDGGEMGDGKVRVQKEASRSSSEGLEQKAWF